jgi:CBS-domain-containing membrane protein
MDKHFLNNPRPYMFQSLIAFLFVVLILYFLTSVTHAAIVAALGSSTFIVFAMPHFPTAVPRRLIGGHVIGVLSGLAGYYLFPAGPLAHENNVQLMVFAASGLSIALSILLMPIFDAHHPPAAGTALGLAIAGWQIRTVAFIIAFAVALSLVRHIMLARLRNLV